MRPQQPQEVSKPPLPFFGERVGHAPHPASPQRGEEVLTPQLGLGIGWRPELAWTIDRHARGGPSPADSPSATGVAYSRRPVIDFVEIIAEDFDPSEPLPPALARLKERGLTIIPHGVSLSLGSAEPPSRKRLDHLASLAERCDAPLVSEHIAFVRGGGHETGHLLPVPRTREMLDILVENIALAQAALGVPLALENIATMLEWPGGEMDDAEFLCELLRRTGVLLLLDLENVYANCLNQGRDPHILEQSSNGARLETCPTLSRNPVDFLDRLPLERVAYVHVAGGFERHGLFHDTHTEPAPQAVFDLVSELYARTDVPGVMLERDGHFPPEPELLAELSAIESAAWRGRSRREAFDAF